MISCEKVTNIGIFVALEGWLKKYNDVSRTIATAMIELFVAIVNTFQLLTNFTKNSSIGAMGVLNAPLEYCKRILKFVQVIKLNIAEL